MGKKSYVRPALLLLQGDDPGGGFQHTSDDLEAKQNPFGGGDATDDAADDVSWIQPSSPWED